MFALCVLFSLTIILMGKKKTDRQTDRERGGRLLYFAGLPSVSVIVIVL